MEDQVKIHLFTRQTKFAIPDAPILVPCKLQRSGLSEIVNHLLALDPQVPFDFLIEGKLLRTSIKKYLNMNMLSTENVLDIEYVESMLPPTEIASFDLDDWISSVKIHSEKQYILLGSYDKTVKVLNLSGETVSTFGGHEAPIKTVNWLNGTYAVSGSMDGRIYAWKLNESKHTVEVQYECVGHEGSISNIAVSSSGEHFASASQDGNIFLWKTGSDDLVSSEDPVSEETTSKKKRKVQAPKISRKIPIGYLVHHNDAVSGVVFSKTDKDVCYSGSWDHTVRSWSISSGSNLSTMNCEKVVLSIDFSGLNHLIATGHSDNYVRLWDSRSQGGLAVKMKLASHQGWVSTVQWANKNQYSLASASYDGSVKIWDIRSSAPLHTMTTGDSDDAHKLLCMDWKKGMIVTGGDAKKLHVYRCS